MRLQGKQRVCERVSSPVHVVEEAPHKADLPRQTVLHAPLPAAVAVAAAIAVAVAVAVLVVAVAVAVAVC